MYHDDFTHAHPHLSGLYGGTDLAARLMYEERLRQACAAQRCAVTDAVLRPHMLLVARFGALLVRWGERLQAADATLAPEHSLDTRA